MIHPGFPVERSSREVNPFRVEVYDDDYGNDATERLGVLLFGDVSILERKFFGYWQVDEIERELFALVAARLREVLGTSS